ncbi:Origin recognition complex subunit 2 [Castilleja foliolosa]|uniref:Origin recognition complex subunit 2 n=1 Tax=Castilleja foliolosa TaxID=1961234 RepID=A0ABD3B6V6_9LAMI
MSSEQSSASSSEKDEEEVVRKPAAKKTQIAKSRDVRRPKDSEYIVTPDNYFMMNSSKKDHNIRPYFSQTSEHDLNENVDEDAHISEEHRNKIAELNQSYEQLFDKWLYVLNENFNVVLYGIGSKRTVLQQFQAEKLQDFPCIVINGFFPSLTMKNGPMLRNAKSQAMLASISQIHNVHTIASIDHINAPLFMGPLKTQQVQVHVWDVTTFLPYRVETSFENSLLTARSGALQLSSLRSVFQSLTTNAKGIFNIIIQYQMENHKQTHYQGLPFKDLYSRSREQFLVSSELALRAQLTEFLDHKLVRMRRSYDGGENLSSH